MKDKQRYKLVYLEWEDACSNTEDKWRTPEECDAWSKEATWIVKQAGYVVQEDKRQLVIAGRMEPGSDNYLPTFGLLQKIPKTWIKTRKYLKV